MFCDMLQFGAKEQNIGLKIRSLERGVGVQVPLSAPMNPLNFSDSFPA